MSFFDSETFVLAGILAVTDREYTLIVREYVKMSGVQRTTLTAIVRFEGVR
jgi:hypothetical protein